MNSIMSLIGIIASTMLIIMGVRDRDSACIMFGIVMTIVEVFFFIGSLE